MKLQSVLHVVGSKRHWEPISWREEKLLSSLYPESPDHGFLLCISCCSYCVFIYSLCCGNYHSWLQILRKKAQPPIPLNKQDCLQASDLPGEIPRLGVFRNSAYRSTSVSHIAKGTWGLFLIHKEAGKSGDEGRKKIIFIDLRWITAFQSMPHPKQIPSITCCSNWLRDHIGDDTCNPKGHKGNWN